MPKLDKLVDLARAHLDAGEVVMAAVRGVYETGALRGGEVGWTGALVATDRRLLFYGKQLGGYRLESFAYGQITSFEHGKTLLGHHVTFFASGNRASLKHIAPDGDVPAFTQAVHTQLAAVADRHRGSAPAEPAAAPAGPALPGVPAMPPGFFLAPPAAPPAPPIPLPPAAAPAPVAEVLGQLRELGELRDGGVLTQDEFDAAKAALLRRL